MISWILIMTIQAGHIGYVGSVASVGTANGFTTQSACIYAGEYWKNMGEYRSYICVSTSKK